jgi:3-oxoacyl-[acyl-carrier protein] reductase
VAYVTGGSRGIGAATCRFLAARGAAVLVGYSSGAAEAEAIAARIREAGGRAETAGGDIRLRETAETAVQKALDAFGRLDILVTSAGASGRQTLAEITEQQYRDIYDTNVLGTIWSIQAAAPHLTAPGGRIIMVSSRMAINPVPGSALYGGAKAAMNAMAEAFAKELGPQGITVNSVAPGLIDTERMHAGVVARGEAVAAETPLRRIGMPDDVAGVVAFLASEDSGWITGRTIRADGGIV